MAKNPFVCGNPSDNDDFVTVECHVAIGNPQTKVSLIIARPVSPKIVVFVPFTIIINNVARIQRVDEAISNVTDKLPHDLIGSSYYDLIYDGDLLTASQLQKSSTY
ncbi:hypothetical protein QR680_001672 [Steinernema hermaphroditum]|uniref:Uncharacterized protein n=1 Tax=Steinernema hermaphroditum TaxID=289476 RepID=A0AA39H253_9BILA|nr:hypothetical protein QR680_001672 [Steinernema hermaphroditum]